ncbi:MAG: hypothetical protein KAH10_07540 [Flavobacteriales bacterium]|nr:hypothetical protein [Flavobacteriales bacterium]
MYSLSLGNKSSFILLLISLYINSSAFSQKIDNDKLDDISDITISNLIESGVIRADLNLAIDSVIIDKEIKTFDIFFSKEFTYLPIREDWLDFFQGIVKNSQRRSIRNNYKINCYSSGELLSNYIPNIYRNEIAVDTTRNEFRANVENSNVKNKSELYSLEKGLQNKHIAIWGGHGLYYSSDDNIWKWQRPNLFTTVEDMLTYSYVVPYIIPMLENAGANVYYPKERDTQTNEYVSDFDSKSSRISKTSGVSVKEGGFKLKDTYSHNENPFKLGTHFEMKSSLSSNRVDSITYKFSKVEKGNYSIYISFSKHDSNISDVSYDVYHDGGKTSYSVNQKMGYSTWIFLGEFHFGEDNANRLVVRNTSKEKGIITSDAIKIGGGYNRIERNSTSCIQPAYMNAGRYYLQYAGVPDSSVYSLSKGSDDYKDDYKSKGEWVNYLLGQPYSINRDSSLQGLNIPIDMSLAFHTDAGITKTDSTIGTLVIHSTNDINMKRKFPDGRSRFASRDLADIVQTEVTEMLKEKYTDKWERRSIWDKRYSEVAYPNVPSMLIELLSHQNLGDMKYGLNPNFKFDVSRSIYIGVLKFLSYSNNHDYIVSPLAVNSFSINYKDKKLYLNWKETVDEKEESARADAYIVYKKVGNAGFDNGTLVKGNEYIFDDINLGDVYSFKVKALNKGGVSFFSETLSSSILDYKDKPVLIMNAFEKLSGPEFIDTDSLGGFPQWKKSSVADGIEYSFTGNQYNFDKNDPWITNPRTGHGASYSDYEGVKASGNTFNYPLVHGKQFVKNGISFVSTSIKAFENNTETFLDYRVIDLIYGKQSTYSVHVNKKDYDYSIFRESTRKAFSAWLKNGKSILISGAFIASDVFIDNKNDSIRTNWVKDNFNYNIVTNNASASGKFIGKNSYKVNKRADDTKYELRSIDAIEPVSDGKIIYRYKDNNYPSAVSSELNGVKILVFGFPIGSVVENRDNFFEDLIEILKIK